MPDSLREADDRLADEEQARLTERHRGVMAQQLLANPLLVEAFAALEAETMKTFRSPRGADPAVREAAYVALRTVDWVKQNIQTHVETGMLAEQQLPGIEQKRKSLAQRMGLRAA